MKLIIPKYDLVLLITTTLALFASIFNSYHLFPNTVIYHNLIVAIILAIGLTICFLFYSKELLVPHSIATWILLLVLIIIQPYINPIMHPDYLVFPIGTLVLIIVLSIAIANIDNKKSFLNMYLFLFIGFMLLSVFIQFMQLRGYELFYNNFIIFSSSSRFDANFTQPNQAAFMLALAELACIYFYYQYRNMVWLLFSALFIIGIALTSSRGGLILGLSAIVLFNAFYNQAVRNKIKNIVVQLIGFSVVYSIGIFIYKSFNALDSQADNAIERFSEGSMLARVSLQEQSWLMFKNSPLTGYGWGNFAKGSIEYANEISLFFFSQHSHFFITQIASELGIIGLICLLPITIFIFKKISFKMDGFNAVCFTAILIVVLYSCSEFPLWYLRFLIIFAVFITLIDTKLLSVNTKYSKILAVVTLGSSILIVLYISSYLKIYNTIRYLATNDLSDNKVEETYNQIPNIFGMSVFKENILFHYIPINNERIDDKLSIAERSVATELTKRNLFRYARLLALDEQDEKSISIFKAACVLDWNGDCDNIVDELDIIAEKEPQVYGKIKYEIDKWVIDFDPKKLK